MGNVENGLLSIDAAASDVDLTINSLHDCSSVTCRRLTLNLTEDARSSIKLLKKTADNARFEPFEEQDEDETSKPALFVDAQQLAVNVLSKYDLLRM